MGGAELQNTDQRYFGNVVAACASATRLAKSFIYITDLVSSVNKAKDTKGLDVSHSDEIETLAKIDWPTAAPLLLNISQSAQQKTSTLVLNFLYQHAMEIGDISKIEEMKIR